MAKTTQEHYAAISVLLNERLLNKADRYYQDLAEAYELALSRIQKEIEAFYQRFSEDNRMDLADAQRILTSSERQRYHMEVEDYIRKGQQLQYLPGYEQELRNASTVYRVTRLEAVELQIRQQVEELYANHNVNLTTTLKDIYTEGRMETIRDLQPEKADAFAALNVGQVEAVITRPWAPDGTTFSHKIWEDRNGLQDFINRELTQSLIRGEGPDRMAKELQHRFGVTSRSAYRLVQTEAAYFSTMAKINSYREMGYEAYVIIAVMDLQTSELCKSLDGTIVPVADFKAGVSGPPFHPHCRTTVAPSVDTPTWNPHNEPIPLNSAEQQAINTYVSADGFKLNDQIRRDDLDDETRQQMRTLDAALVKTPEYNGDITRTTRLQGRSLDDFVEAHQPGRTVVYGTYTSFTTGDDFLADYNIKIYVNNSRRGRDIRRHNQNENEVLYQRGARFKVIDAKEDDGIHHIYLEER